MKPRFFQVGFNRCGTTSIADMLERQGLTAVHHSYLRDGEKQNIALTIADNLEQGRPPLDGMDDIDAFTDVEYTSEGRIVEGYKHFREIAAAYPEMKFILNIRKRDDWIKSRLGFANYPERYAACYGLTREQVIEKWERDWDTHLAAVRAEIPAERLLIMDIDAPDPEAVNAFFDFDAGSAFRRRNKSINGPLAKWAQKALPKGLVKAVPNRWKNYLKDF
ncbi:MAG: hypothetical protein KI788_04975 [Mameliella sp.]|nr:hypothetical protein [Mameliella sp.]